MVASVVPSGDNLALLTQDSGAKNELVAMNAKLARLVDYTPIGAHSSGADISSAVTLTKPAGATGIIIQALTKNVRFRLDGVNPTAAVGFQLKADNEPLLISVPGADICVIQEAATASLQYQWVA